MSSPRPGVVPSVISTNCQDHIKWIKTVFEADQNEIYLSEDGKRVLHCVLSLNGGYLYISDRMQDFDEYSAEYDEEAPGFMLHVQVEDPSDIWSRATANKAMVVQELEKQEWGKLFGCFKDPYGFVWGVMKGCDDCQPGVIPHLLDTGDCEQHLQWLVSALDGIVQSKQLKDGKIQHCSVKMNGGIVYLADNIILPKLEHLGKTDKTTRLICHLEYPDPHSAWKKAQEKGAKTAIELKEQFWGELYGVMKDVMGYEWSVSKVKVEDNPSSVGITPHILSPDCEAHTEWIQKVFGGEVKERFRTPESKKMMHCRMSFNGGQLFLCDKSCGPNTECAANGDKASDVVILHVSLPDPDVVWGKALNNSATEIVELKKQYWGGYYGSFRDPFGVQWGIMKSCGK